MSPRKYSIQWSVVVIVAVVVALLFLWETHHLKIETDILESMPQNDRVLSDARQIIRHLPVQDRLFIDVAVESADKDQLVRAARVVSEKLTKSGIFTKVGISDDAGKFPELIAHVQDSLPVLFNADDLDRKIKPLLDEQSIKKAMSENRRSLEQLEGIGRAQMMAKDPLGFSGVILKQLSALLPAQKAQFYAGQLLSADERHALIIASIAGSGTDTKTAAKIEQLMQVCRQALEADGHLQGGKFTLTSAGAYRAALDNEAIAKSDTRLALILTTLGIALLLLFAFPRPLIGLLALLPSTVGMIAALCVCSFLFTSVSMLAVGFGGAIMGFTVDLGITYLLFLDQPHETYGRQVTRTVWSAELLAVLTTVGSFLLLLMSDFRILAEIGVFSALGVAFALLFVLLIFPLIFPSMPPASRQSNPWLMNAIRRFAMPAKWKLIVAGLWGVGMLFFAWPVFNVDLNAMNSVSPDTIAAEKVIQKTWGDFSGKCYVFVEANSMDELQRKNDRLMDLLAADEQKGKLTNVFLPAVLFPSPQRSAANLQAWQKFWDADRLQTLKRHINATAKENGFAANAFDPFVKSLEAPTVMPVEIPDQYFEYFGIAKSPKGLTQLSLLTTGKNYSAEDFSSRLSSRGLAKLFDIGLFNRTLGDFLKNAFVQIAIIVALGTTLIVFVYYLDWLISLAVLAPVAFALLATLGTLKIIGHPLDIPGIMLWIVIMGMGVNYSIYYASFYQRYRDEHSPAMDTVRLAMFLASFTTLIGFGVLAFARHSLLKSIGLTSLLGIGYSILGAYFILPFLMKKIFAQATFPAAPFNIGSKEHLRRTVLRYRHLAAHPRMFARFKILMDPMFRELDHYVKNPRRIIDIGCGYGIPAVWLLEIYPRAQVFGLEPDEVRALNASYAIGSRGRVQVGLAPDLPEVEGSVDYVLMLDMLHYLDDDELRLALRRIYEKLETGGTLLIRATVPSDRKVPWKRWMERLRLKVTNIPERFRREDEITGFMEQTGFDVQVHTSPTPGVEEKWFVGKKGY